MANAHMFSGVSSPGVRIGSLLGEACSIRAIFEKLGAILFWFGFCCLWFSSDDELLMVRRLAAAVTEGLGDDEIFGVGCAAAVG